jgi:hypothetical protein
MNLEQDFVSRCIMDNSFYFEPEIKGFVKLGLNLDITICHWYQHTPQLNKKMKQPKYVIVLWRRYMVQFSGEGMWYSSLQKVRGTVLNHHMKRVLGDFHGPGRSVGIATGYGLDGTGIESRWGQDFPHLSRLALGPTQPPVQ